MMADDPKKQAADRKRISMSEAYEVEYWTHKFGVSREVLQAAVSKVGPMVVDVERELGDTDGA
jgi:hypothetical protein